MEQWKRIVYNGVEYPYDVSRDGDVRNAKTGRILKKNDVRGYEYVSLYIKMERIVVQVHRLVATMFIPNPDNLPEVDHINRNRHDNSVENLRWVSHKTNLDNTNNAKMVYCVELDRIFDSIKQASVETGLDGATIGKVCRGERKTTGGFHWYFVEEK